MESARLLVHLEKVDDPEVRFAWWADSPDIAGFYSAADYLSDLLEQTKKAINELYEGHEITVQARLVETQDYATGVDEKVIRDPSSDEPDRVSMRQTGFDTSFVSLAS